MNALIDRAAPHPAAARERFVAREKAPLLLCDWARSLFIHYEVDPELLQRQIPFDLDLAKGKAWVSLVAFSMRRMRPNFIGRLGELFFRPIANHEFLNVRTYVQHRGMPGIYFIAEWLNSRVCAWLGPRTYGLPYRFGEINNAHHHKYGNIAGAVRCDAGGAQYVYSAAIQAGAQFAPCAQGSLDEFLLERYTAFTHTGDVARLFHIWHKPWPQVRLEVAVHDESILARTGNWFHSARQCGANYSPGVDGIQMGRPRRVSLKKVPRRFR